MKKILVSLVILLAAACMLGAVGAAVSVGFSVQDVTSMTVSGDPAYTNSVETTHTEIIGAAQKMLTESEKATLPADAAEIARLTLTSSQGEAREFRILRRDEALYAVQGDKVRTVSAEEFYALADKTLELNDQPHSGLYPFRYKQMPNLGEACNFIPQVSHSYSYRKLDGKFHAAPPIVDSDLIVIPSVSLKRGEWPKLMWDGMEGAAQVSNYTVFLSTHDEPDTEAIFDSWEDVERFTPEGGGVYRARLSATYASDYYQGATDYLFDLVFPKTVSQASFSAEGSNTYQGEVVILRAYNVPEGQKIAFSSDIQFTPRFFPVGGGEWIALLPVSYFHSVGSYYVELSAGEASQSFSITLNDKQFQIQNLTVNDTTASETIESQQANAEYEQVIAPLRPLYDEVQHWSGKFILPVSDHNVTTQFGMIRYVNGAPTSVRHGAIDLAVPKGTSVAATNSGRVLYAGYLQLTGNTVLIEHGYGLKSWYYHMDSLSVKTGDMVGSGQKIGTVGSTGFSTGPHLHFGMSVNNVFINPYTVIRTDLMPE